MAADIKNLTALDGRVAVVTGAASGIGVGIAEVLAEAGASIVVADRHEAGAERQAAALREAGHAASAIALDLVDEASVVAACAAIVADHGAPWLLVNNAGLQNREALFDTTVAEFDLTIAVNSRGPFLMTRELGRAMAEAKAGGRIVNVVSNCVLGPMVVGHTSYASSKGALFHFTTTAAFELVEHGITVNAVLPGGVATPGATHATGPAPSGPATSRRPPFGLNDPRDIGAAVLFFASPAARAITNQWIAVDGGFSLT